MKFLKLLDPYDLDERASPGCVGEQQKLAREQFPQLVSHSRLHYWVPGNPVEATGDRLLLGVAASYSLLDLRLADVLNEILEEGSVPCRIDVFNLDDVRNSSELLS